MADKFTKPQFLGRSQKVLEFQLKVLYPVRGLCDATRTGLVFLNHDRNFSTFLTIHYLVEHERVADIYALCRSMFESVVSMGLLAKSVIHDDLDRYQGYQYVEASKTHDHLERLGLARLSGLTESEVTRVRRERDKYVAKYVAKYGSGLPTWTGKSLEQNVRLLDSNCPSTCNEEHFYEYLYCQVYRRGSPAAHASFSGLSKAVDVETVNIPGSSAAYRYRANEPHLIFSCFHSLLVFLSSVRFMGWVLEKPEAEAFFQQIAGYVIAE